MRAGVLIIVVGVCLGCAEERPSDGSCVVTPREIDFGEVEMERGGVAELLVTNQGLNRVVIIEPLVRPFFMFQSSDVAVREGLSARLLLSFLPQDALLHLGELRLTDRDEEKTPCKVTVPLRGLGAGVVVASANSLDFGFLDVGQERTLELRLDNPRREAVSLNLSLEHQLDGPFTFSAPATVMPPRSSLVLSIKAAPTSFEVDTARLEIIPGRGPPIVVRLHFTPGDPIAEFSPLGDLPRVGFSPGSSPPSFADRTVQVRHVGTTGIFNQAQLRLLNSDELDGKPSFTVEALDGGVAEELTVRVPPQLFSGILPSDPRQFGEVNLHLEPRSPGPRGFRITFRTNEPAEHVVMLQTVAEVLPSCSMQVSPTGALELHGGAGAVTFTNTGLETCFIDDLRLINDGNGQYSIVGFQPSQVEVPAGASLSVPIAGPVAPVFSNVAALGFHIFGPNSIREQREIFSAP